jgi:hypothetical protein
MSVVIGLLVIVLAILFLKGFDKLAGRGPKQVSDGIVRAADRMSADSPLRAEPARVPCPQCAEMILPAAKVCRFCGTAVNSTRENTK